MDCDYFSSKRNLVWAEECTTSTHSKDCNTVHTVPGLYRYMLERFTRSWIWKLARPIEHYISIRT